MSARLAALFLVVVLAACGGSVDRESFAAVETGMTEAQVMALLGEPDRTRSITIGGVSGTHHAWEADGHVAAVQLLDGKVVGKEWIPAEH